MALLQSNKKQKNTSNDHRTNKSKRVRIPSFLLKLYHIFHDSRFVGNICKWNPYGQSIIIPDINQFLVTISLSEYKCIKLLEQQLVTYGFSRKTDGVNEWSHSLFLPNRCDLLIEIINKLPTKQSMSSLVPPLLQLSEASLVQPASVTKEWTDVSHRIEKVDTDVIDTETLTTKIAEVNDSTQIEGNTSRKNFKEVIMIDYRNRYRKIDENFHSIFNNIQYFASEQNVEIFEFVNNDQCDLITSNLIGKRSIDDINDELASLLPYCYDLDDDICFIKDDSDRYITNLDIRD